jgi:hypothetical protein
LESWRELAALKRDLHRAGSEMRAQHIVNADARRQEARVQDLEELVQACQKDADQYAKEAEQLGRMPVEVQMRLTAVRQLEEILRAVGEEREKLEIELRAPCRVTVLGDPEHPAEVP